MPRISRAALLAVVLLVCALASLHAPASGAVAPDANTIPLREGSIDTRPNAPARAVAPHLRQRATSAPQLWMIQFRGPVRDVWLDQLSSLGLRTVQYLPPNAYVVWGNGAAVAAGAALQQAGGPVRWNGPYHPAYRLAGSLQRAAATRAASELIPVAVQIYDHADAQATIARLVGLATPLLMPPVRFANLVTLALPVPAGQLAAVAGWADVVNVEPWAEPQLLDERQGQIIAGNLSGTQPSGPGYRAWLLSKGFPTDPARYPLVDVVDDGIDNGNAAAPGHPDFYVGGVKPGVSRIASLQNCTADAGAEGIGGHGTLNAGVLAGYNDQTDAQNVDGAGYSYGLGVAPYARVSGTKLFKNDGRSDFSQCGGGYDGLVAASYAAGAQITSDSWGLTSQTYNAAAQIYDARTRDAAPDVPGNQQMLHVFAAGNAGAGARTITSPATAKNVLSVGATENVRDQGVPDGGRHTDADSADDIARYSSRGPISPAIDGRIKPDIVAPGTHVQGPASQVAGYNGSGISGGVDSPYYPPGQTLYTWSTGTSHAAPAVAGAAALAYEYYGRVLAPGQQPSPAMLKALLLGSARYLGGVGAGDTLPSNSQGWGGANLGRLFDGTPRYLIDQSVMLSGSGQVQQIDLSVADPSKPLDVTMAWTDAPGSPVGAPYVNDLNLEVTVGGVLYRGNVFSGAYSNAGGSADARNNVERVTLPAGASGPISVRVVAANIAGDGVPGDGDATDQDFALVVTNGTTGAVNPQPSVNVLSSTSARAGAEGFTLTVSGANFIPGTVVRWRSGGDVTDLVPTSSTTTTLVVSVPPQLLAA
ncbi:MAG: S8 family serine peptidase, partial [Chloroflexales bacterium]|nr:S8 family serine peptidase [Chloroflexales bacterium]